MQQNRIDKTAHAVKIIVLAVVILAGSCGTGSTTPDQATPGFEPAFDCEGLADRWVVIHQAYLDELMKSADVERRL